VPNGVRDRFVLAAREQMALLASRSPSKPKTKTRKNDNMLVEVWGLGISLFPDSAGNKGRFAPPKIDNMLVVVWGLSVLRGGSGEAPARPAGGSGAGLEEQGARGARLFGAPSWVRMGRQDRGDG
jgi:hypothetical protein